MRILFILEYYYPNIGGVETLFKSLAESLDAQGHEVTVLTNKFRKNLISREEFGDRSLIVRKSFHNRYLFTFFAWWSALKYARNADIIHTTSYNAAVPARIAALWTRTKSIITFHERWGPLWSRIPWMSGASRWLHRLFEHWITRFNFDRYVAVSDATKKSLLEGGVKTEKVERIYNGINYQHFPAHIGSKTDDPFTFIFFGRVGYAKGLDLLLPAYQALCDGSSAHRLILILPSDNHPLLRNVMQLIEELQIDSHITVLHDLPYKELLDQIVHADAVVIPSYSEGFCFAAVETMAIGTPIISSGLGALKEVVGGTHITITEHNDKALTEAMKKAIKGQWDEVPYPEFALDNTIEQYTNLYKHILNES